LRVKRTIRENELSNSDTLSTVGIDVPPGLNATDHNAIHERMVRYKDIHAAAWGSFSAAWKGVVYRYRAACEYSAQFTELNSLNRNATFEERYLQDHALFSFSVSALSTLECFYFGMNCIGCVINQTTFPITSAKDLRFYPPEVVKRYTALFPNEQIIKEMQDCLSAPAYAHLGNMRNVLTHRGAPPRHFKVGGDQDGKIFMPSNPKELSPDWKFESEIDTNTTEVLRAWLEASLQKLLASARTFSDTMI
jgi:hypothetical protein